MIVEKEFVLINDLNLKFLHYGHKRINILTVIVFFIQKIKNCF